MTKLQKKVTSLLVTVRTIEQLNIDKSKAYIDIKIPAVII